MIELLNIDCMEYMATQEDNAFDLAVVDPPYGIKVNQMNMGSRKTVAPDTRSWDEAPPPDEYFEELKRVSKEQIVWGGNYFKQLWPTRGFIIWDKGESLYGRSFAECELAWTSLDMSARIYKKNPVDLNRIHPTQKPVTLYDWIFANYSEPSFKILDTHLGSGSSAIAAHYAGVDFVGCEIDKEYYQNAHKRFELKTQEMRLF